MKLQTTILIDLLISVRVFIQLIDILLTRDVESETHEDICRVHMSDYDSVYSFIMLQLQSKPNLCGPIGGRGS